MTAIALTTDIPTNINTLEKLAAWVGLALARCNPSQRILEIPNSDAPRAAEATLIKADDGSHRLVVRLSIPIADNYSEVTQKFWFNATEVSNTALPAAFKTN